METDGVTLSDQEVRERFSAYRDGELPPAEATAVRRRLEENKNLAEEYQRFCAMLSELSELSQTRPAHGKSDVDLLAGVQQRLHRRSGGKFYRNRWSRTVGVMPIEAIAVLVLALLVLLYFGMTFVSGMKPAGSNTEQRTPAGGR